MTVATVIENDYTLGSGEVSIAKFVPGTKNAAGFRYMGNSPELSYTTDTTFLDHFDADHGLKVKDENVPLTVVQTVSLSTDNVNYDNLALQIFGTKSTITTSAATITAESHLAVEQGLTYQLGQSDNNPVGNRDIDAASAAVVTDDAGSPTTFVLNTDYIVDYVRGRIYIVEGGAIDDGTNIKVTYHTKVASHVRVVSGQTPFEGALKYTSFNAVGEQKDYFFPWVKITPDGDFPLKGDTWQVLKFKMEVLRIGGNKSSIYVDGEAIA